MGLVEGKVIIVTGASSGIGEKTAEVLAAEGAKVVLLPAEKKSWKMWQIVLSQQAVKLIQSVVMSVSEKIATELQRKQ